MKNTHKLIALFLIFSLFIAESCKRKNEPTTINNAFEIFNNQTLVLDSTTSNHLKFVKQQDSVLILKKDSILYAFDIEKINAVFSNDVYGFYDINKEGFSELKLKKFNESEELKTKKEYLSHKKNAIENTIVFIEQDFDCADKYQLDEGSFDLTNTIQRNYIQYNVADFKFKPINEDVALFVEDNCKNISIKVLAILTIDSTKGNIIFKPIKIELFNKNNNSKIDGVGILKNSLNKTEITTIKNKKSNANSHNSNTNKKVIYINELSLELSNDWKKFQNRKTYDDGSVLILSYRLKKNEKFIGLNINKTKYNTFLFKNVYDFEEPFVEQIKRDIPNTKIINKKKVKVDGLNALFISYSKYDEDIDRVYIYENYSVIKGGYLFTITYNYFNYEQLYAKPIVNQTIESIKFK